MLVCLLCARRGHWPHYSITCSARVGRVGGTPRPSALAVPPSAGGDRKDLPLETRIQLSHLHANALKFRARGARRKVRVACGCVGEGALPSDIRFAAVTAR